MNALALRITRIDLFERPVVLRLPFRFGAATLERCDQAFVRIEIDAGGRHAVGAAAELMVPKWFDKSPARSNVQNVADLRTALRLACSAYRGAGASPSPWQLHLDAGMAAIEQAVAQGLPRLVAQFGVAQIDKAVADAALRVAGLGFADGLGRGVLGDPWSGGLVLQRPRFVVLRHTVGLVDRLHAHDPGPDPADGLPATLQHAIRAHGLTHFKLKLCGQRDADIERLTRIGGVLDDEVRGDWRVTLDGNENFASTGALADTWAALRSTPALKRLLERTLLLEQPLPRAIALEQRVDGLGIDAPLILDESDDDDAVFERGLALGYRGISSKACKGLYRSLHSAALVAADPARRLLSGEDLTCQAGLAVQQDTLLAATLGVAHIERNGHHYVDGFGSAPPHEAAAFAAAHPDLYEHAPNGRPRLRIAGGRLALGSLHGVGFAGAAQPDWSALTPLA